MKLTAKIALAVVASICVVLYVNARSQIEAATVAQQKDMREDALDVGRLFRPTVARAWRKEGKANALYLIEYINETLKQNKVETRMLLRWVWLHEEADQLTKPWVNLDALRQVAQGQEASVLAEGPDGDIWRYTYMPVSVGIAGDPPGALEIAESTASLRAYVDDARRDAFTSAAILAGICALIVLAIGAWLVGRPVQKLVKAAEVIGGGDLSFRVDLKQRDEVGALAKAMNSMAERLAIMRNQIGAQHAEKIKTMEQLRHADRLTSVGTFASGIAHELGTPLAVISGRANLIADGTVQGDEAVKYAVSIARQSDKMATIIRQLLDFARRGNIAVARQPLAKILKPTVDLLRPLARKHRVELEFDLPAEPLYVKADGTLLQQVLTNLVVNAIDAMPRGGTVTITAAQETATPPADIGGTPGQYVCCSVQDTGEGMRPEILPRLFEPFFTTKGIGKGTGLGLAVSYGIVSEHRGWIDVETELGKGSRFKVYLPAGEHDSADEPRE